MQRICPILATTVMLLCAPFTFAAEIPVEPGLVLWLRSDSITTSGTNVTGWLDRTGILGIGDGVSQDTNLLIGGPTLVAGAVNGHDSVNFGGSGGYKSNATLGLVDFTAFAVGQNNGANSNERVLQVGNVTSGANGATVGLDVVDSGAAVGGAGTRYNNGNNTFTPGWEGNNAVYHISTFSMANGGTYGSSTYRIDGAAGTSDGSTNPGNIATFAGANDTGYALGVGVSNTGGNNDFLTGRLAEVILFSTQLSASDINRVEFYLDQRYNLGLGIAAPPDVFFDNLGPGSDWGTPTNWDTAVEPLAGQNVFINGGLTADVTLAGEVANNLTVGSENTGGPNTPGQGTLNILSGGLNVGNNFQIGGNADANRGTVNQIGGAVVVGNDLLFGGDTTGGGTQSLYDLDGGTLTVNGNIEQFGSAVRGHLYIDDPNALTVTGNIDIQSFRVGDSEDGSHTVNPGQTLTTTGTLLVGRAADGDLTILSSGNSANNLTVGDVNGSAGSTLTLNNGATLNVTSNAATALDVGDANGSSGVIDIRGGSTLTSQGQIDLGQAGNAHGEINVTSGTLNANSGFNIAGDDTGDSNTTGDVTVGGSGQVNVAGGNTEVGRGGTGSLSVSGIFNQNTNNLVLAQGANAMGTVDVNNGGVVTLSAELNMNQGTSEFNIHSGGMVTVGTQLQMANNNSNSVAELNIFNGASLSVGTRFELGDNDDANNGQAGSATVNQFGGTVSAGELYIAHASSGNASPSIYNMDGGTLTVNGQMEVGHRGLGFLNQTDGIVNVTAGNMVVGQNNTSAVGEANIDGGTLTVANDLNIGNRIGEVNQTGGNITANRVRIAANNNSVTGDYNLTGDGAGVELTVVDDLNVGEASGVGTFTQTAGQVVVGDIATIGVNTGSTGVYDISGGSLDVTNDALRIGENGSGTLNVSGTGQVNAAAPGSQIVLGRNNAASSGTVNVSDDGLLRSNTNMTIAQAGSGQVNQSGGTVHVEQNMFLGTNAGTGEYNLSGGVLTFADTAMGTQSTAGLDQSTLEIGSNGTFNFDGGTLMNVRNILPDNTFVQDGGRFVIGQDGVDVAMSPDRAYTTIMGDYDQKAGSLVVDVFGPGSHGINGEQGSGLMIDPLSSGLDSDILEVSGIASLDGIVEVNRNGFETLPFAYYDVLVASDIALGPNFDVEGVNLFRVITDPTDPSRSILQVATPEPASIALWTILGLGLVGFGYRTVRRRP